MNAPHPVTNACDCHKCRAACSHKPGWFLPDQIEPLAEALGLTEKELFDQHLQVDWWAGTDFDDEQDGDVFVLSPAVIGGDAGDMFDRDPTGVCRWFRDGKCAIHDLGKPHECAAYIHSEDDGIASKRHEDVAQAWNRPEHQEKIKQLLGREPESGGDWSIFDQMLGGLFR